MELNVNIWVWLSLFGFAQGIFLSFVLFVHKRGNVKANKILAVLIFLFSLRLGEFIAYWTPFFKSYPHFLFTTSSFQFLFGVLLFFYSKALLDNKFVFRKIHLLHLIPFLLQLSSLLPFYFQSSEYKIDVFNNIILTDSPDFSVNFFVIRSIVYLHLLVYSAMTLSAIRKNARTALNGKHEMYDINFYWLKNMAIGFIIYAVLSIIYLADLGLFGYEHITIVDSFLMFFSSLLIFMMGYFALRKPEIISGEISLKKLTKYEKSSLTEQKAELYLTKLTSAMENDKLYLNNDLTLQKLSEYLKIHPNHLSQVINEKLNQNFFDFINTYRIREARELLSDPANDNITILSIAHESGFNNKSSFNSAFKKHTGSTPSDFRNSIKASVN